MTLSHPAAVLPLRRLGLPMTALVIGSMVPDVPLFLRWLRGYELSHTLLGVATVDAALALVAVGLWFAVVRDALVDLAPDPIRSRLTAHVTLTPREWILVVPAAWLGALTHVAWDGFTHPGRWGVERFAWLRVDHGPLPGYKWAQYVSGALGLAIVCVAVVGHLRSRPSVVRPTPRPAWADRVLLVVTVAVATTAVVTAAMNASSGLHAVAFNSVVNAIIAALASVAVLCVVWCAARASREPSQPARRPPD